MASFQSITGFSKKTATVKDLPAPDFIRGYADYLKKGNKIKLPEVIWQHPGWI